MTNLLLVPAAAVYREVMQLFEGGQQEACELIVDVAGLDSAKILGSIACKLYTNARFIANERQPLPELPR